MSSKAAFTLSFVFFWAGPCNLKQRRRIALHRVELVVWHLVGLTTIVCSVLLPSYPANSATFPSAQAEPDEQWHDTNQCRPDPAMRPPVPPCKRFISITSQFPILFHDLRQALGPFFYSSLRSMQHPQVDWTFSPGRRWKFHDKKLP